MRNIGRVVSFMLKLFIRLFVGTLNILLGMMKIFLMLLGLVLRLFLIFVRAGTV